MATETQQPRLDGILRGLLTELNYRRCETAWSSLWRRHRVRVEAVVWSTIWVQPEGKGLGLPRVPPGDEYSLSAHPEGLLCVSIREGKERVGVETMIPLREVPDAWRLVYGALREREVVHTWPLQQALADVDPTGPRWYRRLVTADSEREQDELLIRYRHQLGLLATEPEYLIQLVRLHHTLGLGREYGHLTWLL